MSDHPFAMFRVGEIVCIQGTVPQFFQVADGSFLPGDSISGVHYYRITKIHENALEIEPVAEAAA